ncbi:MAG TPA: glycosyltransferase [Anaerolineales bacterium]|nr:glycosyltransferase [Anaerolineales bacterium]
MSEFFAQQPQVIVVFLALGLLTALSNHLSIRRFDQYPQAKTFPRVSILVPARNEADNIEPCVRSLLAQDYPDFEVIVLDDHSTDDTRAILTRLARTSERLRVMDGKPLPSGWLGKHWACHQLAQVASGDLLLFTDADTRHAPTMLRDSVSALMAEQADLVTAFPREETITWGEKLIIPVMGFGVFAFLPVMLARHLKWASLSVSIGQFMLFRRSAFDAIGGFESVREHVLDDVMLGRRIIQQGFVWRLMDGTRHVSCRMYRGFWEAVEGFTKNIFAFFDYHLSLFIIAWLWMAYALLMPPLVVLAQSLNMPFESYPYSLAVLATAEAMFLWGIACQRFRFPLYLALLYPISFGIFVLIAFRSLVYTLLGQATWKDRELARSAWRW